MPHEILVVDDESDIRSLICGILSDEGYTTRQADSGVSAMRAIHERSPSLIILDVWLGNAQYDGMRILNTIKRDHPFLPVIMVSGHGTVEMAVQAIHSGAYDFIEKPFKANRLLLVIKRALESAQLRKEVSELRRHTTDGLVLEGGSTAIQAIRTQIQKVAPTGGRVFITGPNGSGKQSLARAIHMASTRAEGPFIALSCSAMKADALEVELFGTDIDAADPSQPRKIGLLEQAHGGTLFLDEVADMPYTTQAKVVKVLQDQCFSRLGGAEKIKVDLRVIASTSADPQERIAAGTLREDLYYRLNVVPIKMPSLRERLSDIPLLAEKMMAAVADTLGCTPRLFGEDALVVMKSYPWPGNIQQLRNAIEWILIMYPEHARQPVTAAELPTEIRDNVPLASVTGTRSNEMIIMPLREARELFEREYLMAQVNRFSGNISQTANFIGMERSALHRKLRALGLAGTMRGATLEEHGDLDGDDL